MTYEVIRVPADGAEFFWRVSIAQIDADGPFSDFSGYRRYMMLLEGAGVRLTIDEQRIEELRRPGDLATFDGRSAVRCELLEGPCVDLNLIVADDLRARVWTQPALNSTLWIDRTLLVMSVSTPLVLDVEGKEPLTLSPWDLAVIPPRTTASLRPDELITGEDGVERAGSSLLFLAALEGPSRADAAADGCRSRRTSDAQGNATNEQCSRREQGF